MLKINTLKQINNFFILILTLFFINGCASFDDGRAEFINDYVKKAKLLPRTKRLSKDEIYGSLEFREALDKFDKDLAENAKKKAMLKAKVNRMRDEYIQDEHLRSEFIDNLINDGKKKGKSTKEIINSVEFREAIAKYDQEYELNYDSERHDNLLKFDQDVHEAQH